MSRTILLLLLASRSRRLQQTNTGSLESKPITTIDPTTAATITGTVHFEGAVPATAKIDMSNDPDCGAKLASSENLLVDHGNLANVFVYVKDGLGDRGFAPPQTPVTIDQRGCRLRPACARRHDRAARPRPQLRHHHPQRPSPGPRQSSVERLATCPTRSRWPRPSPNPKSCSRSTATSTPGCTCTSTSSTTPSTPSTGPDGRFELKGLPPGDYTVAAVHEQLGEANHQKSQFAPKETKQAVLSLSMRSSVGVSRAQRQKSLPAVLSATRARRGLGPSGRCIPSQRMLRDTRDRWLCARWRRCSALAMFDASLTCCTPKPLEEFFGASASSALAIAAAIGFAATRLEKSRRSSARSGCIPTQFSSPFAFSLLLGTPRGTAFAPRRAAAATALGSAIRIRWLSPLTLIRVACRRLLSYPDRTASSAPLGYSAGAQLGPIRRSASDGC